MVAQAVLIQEPQLQIVRWTISVAVYDRMREAGFFTENDRVELIDGEVRVMSPIGALHAMIVNEYASLLNAKVGTSKSAIVSIQNPFQLTSMSEPQPDLMFLRYRDDKYRNEL